MKKNLKLLIVMSLIMTILVGCSNIEKTTALNEIGAVEDVMTEKNDVSESITESTETPVLESTPTEEPTPAPEPTVEPTETPTPEPTSTETPVHKHNYTETIITEALCNTKGVKKYSCSCGNSYEEEYIDTHNHQADGNPRVLKESDCIHRGIYGEICLRCGLYVNSKTLDLIDHVPVNYWVYFPEQNLYCLGCANCNYTIESTSVKPEGVEIKEATPYHFD